MTKTATKTCAYCKAEIREQAGLTLTPTIIWVDVTGEEMCAEDLRHAPRPH